MPNQSKRAEMRGTDDGRPRVGPADPATIRRKLAEQEESSRREARAGLYQDRMPPKRVTKPIPTDASGLGGRMRREKIDRAVEGK
jgi:hypothetical protein